MAASSEHTEQIRSRTVLSKHLDSWVSSTTLCQVYCSPTDSTISSTGQQLTSHARRRCLASLAVVCRTLHPRKHSLSQPLTSLMPSTTTSKASSSGRVQLAPAPVARGKQLWTWDGVLCRFGGVMRMPARMVIAGYPLPHGRLGLVVIAPLNPSAAVVEWLQATGDVNFVVAPNKQHYWWAAAMKEAFPGSLLVAPLGLALAHKTLPVDVRVTQLAGPQDLPGSWPLQVLDVMTVQGLPLLQELVLLHKPSSTLILTDIAFNFCDQDEGSSSSQQQNKEQQQQQQQDKTQPLSQQQAGKQQQNAQDQQQQQQQQQQQLDVSWPLQLYLNLAGGHRRCCLTKPFKYLISDAVALKDSLDLILSSWEFDKVSLAHGHFISRNGKQAFADGTVAFVNELAAGKTTQQGGGGKQGIAAAAAGAGGGGGGLAGTGAALLVAATVIGTAVGIGVAGILQARSGQ